jgi:methyl-accepting chemotaxis protein
MSIMIKSQRGATIIIAVVALAITIAGFGISRIRIGGPIHHQNQQISDFFADTLPPPLFVIEPYLEASLLLQAPDTLPQQKAKLAQLESGFQQRTNFWRESDLDEELKAQLATGAHASGQTFWKEMDETFLPAIAAKDMVAAQTSYQRLSALYVQHRGDIDALTTKAQQRQQALQDSSSTTLNLLLALLGGIGLLLIAMLVIAKNAQEKFVLRPLHHTADTMVQMAAGQLDTGITTQHRNDEIGMMTRSIEVFRTNARALQVAATHQAQLVKALSKGLQQLAEGNLQHRIQDPLASDYESLRLTFNQSLAELSQVVGGVTQAAERVNKGAKEIHEASSDLARRNEAQSGALDEARMLMEQVSATIAASANNARAIQDSIAQAHLEASDGGDVVERASAAMSDIERSSEQIGQIVNLIDGIAFQTNLLALNAGVEAARAGDAGKGFAVVASEVRALAQRSADAAHDIKALISGSTEQVAGGVELVRETGDLLSRIVARVGEIRNQISEIADASAMEASHIAKANQAIGQVGTLTQRNVAMSEEAIAAARCLSQEATAMAGMVEHFKSEPSLRQAA